MHGVLVVCVLLAGGCHVVFPIEKQGADAGSRVDSPVAALPRVFSSPSPASLAYQGYPRSLDVTLAADDPAARIYYTIDGSEPTTASPMGVTPLTVAIATTTALRFFAENAAGRSATSLETFIIATVAADDAGYVVTGTALVGGSPVVIATPGQVLSANADVQIWVQASCPQCQAQLVYGIGIVDHGCIVDVGPGVYPGAPPLFANRAFTVQAPMTPGIYEVRVAHIEMIDCAEATSMMALENRPTTARIGVIIVR